MIERQGRKVKALHIEVEFSDTVSPAQFTRAHWPNGLTTSQLAKLSEPLTEGEPESRSRVGPRFVLRSMHENDPMTDTFIQFLQDDMSSH